MARGQTPEQVDAIARARAEVILFLGKPMRRLKARAESMASAEMVENPMADPDEVGRNAFDRAVDAFKKEQLDRPKIENRQKRSLSSSTKKSG